MNPVRKILGLMVIIFFAIPAMFAVIWAVGITQAVVSPEFLSEFPKDIINKVPKILDEVIEKVDLEDVEMDDDARAWLMAASKSKISIKDMLEKSGLTKWLEGELSQSLSELGEMLRGNIEPAPIVLDLRPLKEAIRSEVFNQYFIDIVQHLPQCQEGDLEVWKKAALDGDFTGDLPACLPMDPEIVKMALNNIHLEAAREIPDEVDIIEGDFDFPSGINISRFVVSLTYLLFLLPLLFVLVGAVIADSTLSGFLKWTGLSILFGGLIPFGIATFAHNIIPWSLEVSHYHYFNTQLHEVLVHKLSDISQIFFDHIFSPVVKVSGIVCVAGLIIFALSFIVSIGRESDKRMVPQEKSTSVEEKEEEQE